ALLFTFIRGLACLESIRRLGGIKSQAREAARRNPVHSAIISASSGGLARGNCTACPNKPRPISRRPQAAYIYRSQFCRTRGSHSRGRSSYRPFSLPE